MQNHKGDIRHLFPIALISYVPCPNLAAETSFSLTSPGSGIHISSYFFQQNQVLLGLYELTWSHFLPSALRQQHLISRNHLLLIFIYLKQLQFGTEASISYKTYSNNFGAPF